MATAFPDDSCSQCCTCPTPTVEARSKYADVVDQADSLFSGSITRTFGSTITNTYSGGLIRTYDPDTDTWSTTSTATISVTGDLDGPCSGAIGGFDANHFYVCDSGGILRKLDDGIYYTVSGSGCESVYSYGDWGTYHSTETPHSKETVEDWVNERMDRMPWSDWGYFGDGVISFYDGEQFNASGPYACPYWAIAKMKSQYRLRFKIPKVGAGACYRASWVERFIPEAGVGLTSVEVVSAGVYRPAVTWSGGGGTGLVLVAVMAADGSVSAVRVLKPGAGFTSAPTVTIAAALSGGTRSTGWVATLAGDVVASVTRSGGSAGDYLPTIAFTEGGGIGATATPVMDEQGGIAAVTLSGGSGYAAEPLMVVGYKVSGAKDAVLHLHLGTETAKCAVWDGAAPAGYDPASSLTYPTLPSSSPGYFEADVPTSEGVVTIANIRAYCDCAPC